MGEVLEVGTLGGLRLRVGGRPLTPPDARSAEALLVYLALQEREVARSVLAHLLWPERDGERARANLRSAVYRLRRLLPDHLHADRRSVGLRGEVAVDAIELERTSLAGDVTAAAALYRGDFLAGFHLDGSPEFEAWAASEAERLRTLVLAAHQVVIERALVAGAAEEALRAGWALLELEPLHEPTHRVVMRLLHGAGRAPEALAHHAAFRRRLVEEVGMQPDEVTTRLADAIRRGEGGDPTTEAAVPSTPLDGVTAAAKVEPELPSYGTPFVGRASELATLLRRLDDPDCRWLTVIGPGGAGKTRLVVEAIRRRGNRASEPTVFVPLAGVTTPELLIPTIAEGVGVPPVPMRDGASQLLAYLRDRRLLLVVDSLEHLAEGVAALADVLRRAPSVRILATSRTRLHLSEECLLPLGGLALRGASEALFVGQAARLTGDVDPVRYQAAIARICELVGGLPLAIELAAASAHALSPDAIAAAFSTCGTGPAPPTASVVSRPTSRSA